MNYRVIGGRTYCLGIENNLNERNNKVKTLEKKEVFRDILNEKIIEQKNYSFKISNHAKERLREIKLTDYDYRKIEEGLEKAREKASKNTVILYKKIAFLASVENNTVITVVENERAKDNIFTNIDSVVMID